MVCGGRQQVGGARHRLGSPYSGAASQTLGEQPYPRGPGDGAVLMRGLKASPCRRETPTFVHRGSRSSHPRVACHPYRCWNPRPSSGRGATVDQVLAQAAGY